MIAMPVCEPHLYDKWDSERKIRSNEDGSQGQLSFSYYSLPQFYTVISGGKKTKFGKIVFGNPSSTGRN